MNVKQRMNLLLADQPDKKLTKQSPAAKSQMICQIYTEDKKLI